MVMLEGFDMLANRGFQVLPLGKVDVLTTRVAENVAKQLHLAACSN